MVVHAVYLSHIWPMAATHSDQDIIRLRKEIESSLDWGEAGTWHSKMFSEFSEKVFESTHVMLSVPTLKRFFGVVNHEGSPSITTLDALSRFVGKENWRAFKTEIPRPKAQGGKILRKPIYISIGFILAVIIISLVGSRRPALVINATEFSFSSKVLSNEYPNTVVFDFEIPQNIVSDSIQIQQYWDPTKTIKIRQDQKQATGIYYFPGYFEAKLLVDNQVAQAHDLFLKSNGWLGLIEYESIPKYFLPEKVGSAISFPDHISEEVANSEKPLVSSFHYIDDLGAISGDNFNFQAKVSNAYDDRWATCQRLHLYFIGTSGAMIIPFSKIGCTSDHNLMLNDKFLSGKEHDLSALNADFSETVSLEVKIENKVMQVLINDQFAFEQRYDVSMGRLVGLRFKFLGMGAVESFQLKNQQHEIVL